MTGPSDDERFAELIAREFGDQVEAAAAPVEADPVTGIGFRTWTPAEEPEEAFVPTPVAPAGPWHQHTVAGIGLIVFAVVILMLSAFGVLLPTLVAVIAGAAFFGGVALLLYRHAQRPPTDGDGAVV